MEWWNNLKEFTGEVKAETKKVTWPSRKEVLNTTVVVVIASFIFGFYLYVCDVVFFKLIQGVFDVFS